MSPWLALDASKKNDGVPVDAKVAEIFFAIIPDFPTPDSIILPFLHFKIVSTALLNEKLIFDLNFLKNLFLFQLHFLQLI